MRALTATELLGAWERGLSQSPVHRALTLLALTEATPAQIPQLSIGQRDAQLLALRERAFGPQMTGLATCPACGLQLELDFNVADVRVPPPTDLPNAGTLSLSDCEVGFRLPNSQDLASLASGDASMQRRALLERCVLHARHNGQPISIDQLPTDVVTAVSERMAETDPQADVQLALSCLDCGHHWQAPLDIVSFLWSEIHAWAIRLLCDVHALASTYGWHEADILAMSPWRRQAYLELIER